MIATLRECPEIGVGVCTVLDGHRPGRCSLNGWGYRCIRLRRTTPALLNLGLLIRWPIGLIVREIGID